MELTLATLIPGSRRYCKLRKVNYYSNAGSYLSLLQPLQYTIHRNDTAQLRKAKADGRCDCRIFRKLVEKCITLRVCPNKR